MAHVILEAEEFLNLPTASWSPREVGGILQSESEDLRTREADKVNPSPQAREDEMKCPRSSRGKKGGNLFLLKLLFCSNPQQIGQCPNHTGEDNLLSSLIKMLILSGNPFTNTPRNNV